MTQKRLPEVCKIQYGFPFDSAMFTTFDGMPLVRIRDVVRGYSETYTSEQCSESYIVDNGDLLIGMDGDFNIAKWNGGKALLNQRVCRLIPNDKIDKDYLFFFMPSALKKLEEQTPFVTVKHLSAKQLNSITIPVPELDEQKHISKALGKASALIQLYQGQLAKLDELVKARFIEMFGDIESNPYGWLQTTIGSCCSLKSGTSLPSEKENEGGTVPYIKVGDMSYPGNEHYITTSSRFVSIETAGAGIFPVGTVIFPKRGGAIGTNKKRLTSLPICADLNVMGVTAGSQLTPQYLMAYFNAIDLGALDNGSSVPQINNKDIAPLVISIPPLPLQNQFAAFAIQVDKSKATVQSAQDKAQLLFDSLMQKYFG